MLAVARQPAVPVVARITPTVPGQGTRGAGTCSCDARLAEHDVPCHRHRPWLQIPSTVRAHPRLTLLRLFQSKNGSEFVGFGKV